MKEESEAKRLAMDSRHHFIISIIADKLEMNSSEVEDHLLEGHQVIMIKLLLICFIIIRCKQWMTSLLQVGQSIY